MNIDFEINKREMLRYWGVKGEISNELMSVAKKAISLCENALAPKIVFCEFDCKIVDDNVTIGKLNAKSRDLAKCLKNCDKAIMLCATAGMEVDKLINRYNGVDMALSTAISAAGSSAIEEYLDAFCNELKLQYEKSGKKITPRFSAGYGDLSLEHQKDFFEILNITKRIGVVLSDSLLMTPSKSVTAIIGIREG